MYTTSKADRTTDDYLVVVLLVADLLPVLLLRQVLLALRDAQQALAIVGLKHPLTGTGPNKTNTVNVYPICSLFANEQRMVCYVMLCYVTQKFCIQITKTLLNPLVK